MTETGNCKLVRYTTEIRAGLVLLALPMLVIGVWALVSPSGFNADFPGGGRQWLPVLGPYNEHMVRDFSAFNLGVGLLLVFAAATIDRRLVQGALIAVAIYSAPHLGYHLTTLDLYDTTDDFLNVVALSLNLLVPLAMLALARSSVQSGSSAPRRPASAPVAGGARVSNKEGALVRFTHWYTRREYGREIAVTPVMAQSRPNFFGYGMFEWWHERSKSVDTKLKMLAATKAATKIGCEFCIDIASHLSREAGVTDEQLKDFHSYRTSPAFSPIEKLVMEYAEEMSKANVDIPDELFARLHEHFDDEQIVELTAAIAIENFRARFNDALQIPPAGFSEGMYCPLPEKQEGQAVEAGSGSA